MTRLENGTSCGQCRHFKDCQRLYDTDRGEMFCQYDPPKFEKGDDKMPDEREKIEEQLEEAEDLEGQLDDWIESVDVMTSDIEEMMSTAGIYGVDDSHALGAFQDLEKYRDKLEAKRTQTKRDVRDLEEELRRLDDEDAEIDDELAELLEAS